MRLEFRPGPWLVSTTGGASAAILGLALGGLTLGALAPLVSLAGLTVGIGIGIAAARSSAHTADGEGRWSTLDVAALAAFAAAAWCHFGRIVFERDGALLTPLPYNLGDLPLHWTYVQFLAGGAAFWPENPILTGERLRYPLGVDLLTAALVQLGAPLRLLLPAFGLGCSALAALALHRWARALAVAGFLFSGGLAGFELLWTARLEDYQATLAWKNLFLALFVPQRGLLLGLPAGLLVLWSERERLLRRGRGLPKWVAGLLWGALPMIHLHTFLLVSVVIAVWAVGAGAVRRASGPLLWALAPAAFSVWEVTGGFGVASLIGWQPGWLSGPGGPIVSLLLNFGVFVPLALVALAVAWRERRREELLLLGPSLALFAALWFFRLAPWAWDNTKVLLWCYLLALPAVESMVLRRLPTLARGAAVFALLFSGAVSVLAASLGRGPRLEVLDLDEYGGVCGALADVPRSERIATAPTFNHPVALCGHPLVAGYAGHLWSHGHEASEVQHRLSRLMRGAPGWREEARRLRARLLFWGSRERVAYGDSLRPWEESTPVLAAGAWGGIYRLE